MPGRRANVKNEKQYEALKDKGMSKQRAARIANSPGASSRGGKRSHSKRSSSSSRQGGTTAQKKAAGRKGGKAARRSASISAAGDLGPPSGSAELREDLPLVEVEEVHLIGPDLVDRDVIVSCVGELPDDLEVPLRIGSARDDRGDGVFGDV